MQLPLDVFGAERSPVTAAPDIFFISSMALGRVTRARTATNYSADLSQMAHMRAQVCFFPSTPP
ncbi:MAG: hypothetical protein EOO33_09140 [Comamonadaceae bacterium]|nr:MAG: hypothetical protein EOO33_09140 [Comamonadaceae bacterium]